MVVRRTARNTACGPVLLECRTALWRQESDRITTKADCYGFAVLMWELATRLYPWLGLGLLHVRLNGSVRGVHWTLCWSVDAAL